MKPIDDGTANNTIQQENRQKPQPEPALNCPRCDSTNTKFCYYNNYSLSQPRYFCKSCRRYWTQGGSLRNIPFGGGCRRNKRSAPSSPSSTSSSTRKSQEQTALINSANSILTNSLPFLTYKPNEMVQDLIRLQKQHTNHFGVDVQNLSGLENYNSTFTANPGFFQSLKTGFLDTQNDFQNLGHGSFHGSFDELQHSMMALPMEDVNSAAATGELGFRDSKTHWGIPWPIGGENNGILESGRDYLSGGSYWHGGLVHPPMI